jgi:hypothetical protein
MKAWPVFPLLGVLLPSVSMVAQAARVGVPFARLPCTEQTGQVQTPSVSPDGTRIAYLWGSGGHVNVWVAGVDGATCLRRAM